MKWLQIAILLCMVLFLNPIFALDYEMVSFDPLPDNAEELARAHVEEFLTQRYPEETIVVGEAIPLYVLENEIKALDFIMELDGNEPCTFEKELEIYTNCEEKNEAYQSYRDTVRGNHEAQVIINNGEDEVYNRIFNELLEAVYVCDSISHIVIAFEKGAPRIIGTHNLDNLLRYHSTLTEDQKVRFLGFGLIPFGSGGVYLANVLIDKDKRDELEWFFGWDFEYFYTTEYPIYIEPMKWSFFSGGFRNRGKEDIPPWL